MPVMAAIVGDRKPVKHINFHFEMFFLGAQPVPFDCT